jgi:hypothetical protein
MMRIARTTVSLFALTATVALTTGCKKEAPKPAPERPAAAAAAESAPTKAAPWYVGDWNGTYQASIFKIEMTEAQGAVKEWAKDDPSSLTGSGSLTLAISEDRQVSGKADGPLGSLVASGEVDGETLRVSLRPAAPVATDKVSSATFIATHKGEGFEGQLRASTGNSLKVRVATLSLSKQGAAAPTPSKT